MIGGHHSPLPEPAGIPHLARPSIKNIKRIISHFTVVKKQEVRNRVLPVARTLFITMVSRKLVYNKISV